MAHLAANRPEARSLAATIAGKTPDMDIGSETNFMSTARSAFTEAIEDHLALKKQNSALEPAMPLARYDVGDPLDRYPGGPNRAADPGTVIVAEGVATELVDDVPAPSTPQMPVGPSPEQAMEAATALEPAFADHPFEPLNGMAPMLSLVEDIDEEDDSAVTGATSAAPSKADVLRFPGGVGPRDEANDAVDAGEFAADAQLPMETHAFTMPTSSSVGAAGDQASSPEAPAPVHEMPTGEQPVLVIDADEPLATSDWAEPAAPARSARRSKPRFFGLGRKKSAASEKGEGWFDDGPRDFNWD